MQLQTWMKDRWIDVRSPGEFAHGEIPGTVNLPILDNHQRHLVGLCYKQQGSAAAIQLGQSLVSRTACVDAWTHFAHQQNTLIRVMCWRGGLRSQTAAEWLREAGIACEVVPGGYKAVRRELLRTITQPRSYWVLSGWTGSGKTQLLRNLHAPILDLEKIANHRGSSFGAPLLGAQPPQATFENRLGWELLGANSKVLIIEDESRMIGRSLLAPEFYAMKSSAPVIWIDAPVTERAQRIFTEYIDEPRRAGFSHVMLHGKARNSTLGISRKLGGLLTQEILTWTEQAFASDERDDFSAHQKWIETLLTRYYDKLYQHAWEQAPRPILFRGSWKECQQWIQLQFV